MKIYGLTNDEKSALQQLANTKLGKPSISSFAKHLLINEITQSKNTKFTEIPERKTERLEVRLSKTASAQLEKLAKAEGMSLNRYAIMILHNHINKENTLTTNEVTAVQHSNYQLYKLGVNLNQIAKALNSNTSTNLSSTFLADLQKTINEHFTSIGKLIQKSKERY